jgi:hypothetical protein
LQRDRQHAEAESPHEVNAPITAAMTADHGDTGAHASAPADVFMDALIG